MRSSITRCALVVLTFFFLAGCRTTESGWHVPSWSLSSLNPFSSSDEMSEPLRPSELATPAGTASPGAGYAAASSSTTETNGYPNAGTGYDTSAGTYPSTQRAYPAGSAGAMRSAVSANPATTPQSGSYAPPPGSSYSRSLGSNPYGSPGAPTTSAANSGYQAAAATGPYGNNAGTAPRYDTASDRYGLGGSGSGQPDASRTAPGAATDPYTSVPDYAASQNTDSQGIDSRYGSDAGSVYGATGDSRYQSTPNSASYSAADSRYSATPGTSSPDSRYGTGSQYGNNASASVSDPYTAVRSDSTSAARPGANSYRNGEYQSTSGTADWNPGDTGYQPGNTGYEPGNTGYTPPGTSPYRSSVGASAGSSYLPGSTKFYGSPKGNESAPEQSESSTSPRPDSYVIPAAHTRL